MLASAPVRAAALRAGDLGPAAGAAAVAFCALFFGGGSALAPLVWIGGATLLLAALAFALGYVPGVDGPVALFAGCLVGLAVWAGLTTIWSISPDRTWSYTNRTLVYAAFALLGLSVGARVSRAALAGAAASLLGLLVGWALLAKCVPGLYDDYGRVARLRAPLTYWNELALLCAAGVPIALWLATRARRATGAVLLYGLVLTLLLTYSRFGVALACLVAAAWVLLGRARLESLVVIALSGGAGAAAFGIAFALPGITSDAQPRSVRAHDGWIFALVVVAGAGLVFVAARYLSRFEVGPVRRARVERAAGIAALALAIAGLAVSIVFAGRIWGEFTNPAQLGSTKTRLTSASSPRWTWWQEAWHAFTRHPLGGTGAGTFEITHQMLRTSPVVVDEPHNTPLQFLSETGIVGFLLYLGAAAGALWGAWRARGDPAGLALGLSVAAFFAHTVVDKDWSYVAGCGPLLLLAGALVARPAIAAPRPRPLLAVSVVAVAIAVAYSLAAPWLAERRLESASSASDAKQARSYDPLSVDALWLQAAYEDADRHPLRAARLYQDAVDLEPENAETWYALGEFYFSYKEWQRAYEALNNAYTYDRFGKAGERCGLLDQARTKATGYTPPKLNCRGSGRSSSP
jgi:O-Antigen ligase